MKDFDLKERELLFELKGAIWHIVDKIWGMISGDEYFVILYSLTLIKENIPLVVNGYREETIVTLPDINSTNLDDISQHTLKTLSPIHQVFKPILEKIASITRMGLDDLLASSLNDSELLEDSFLRKHFPEIFEELLYELSKYRKASAGEHLLPSEFSRFICNLIEPRSEAKVYNPFAGFASFNIFLNNDVKYVGQEINELAWAIGSLRIRAHGKSDKSKFYLGDSIYNWPENEKFDLIVADPPLWVRLSDNIKDRFGNIKYSEDFFIEKGINSLSPNGNLIAIIPHGFLYRGGTEKKLRQFLIENDLIETIISFPGGLLFNTNLPVVVMVIDNNKTHRGTVRYVDAKEFVQISSHKRRKELDDNALISLLRNERDDDCSSLITIEKIRDNEFILLPARYMGKEATGVELRELVSASKRYCIDLVLGTLAFRELAEPFSGPSSFVFRAYPYVRIRDLNANDVNYQLDINNCESLQVNRLPKTAFGLLESSLLVATKYNKLLATFVESSEAFFIAPDIIALKVDESKVDIDYLIYQLSSDHVAQQLKKIRLGEVIPYYKKNDLLKLKILLPSLLEQRAIIKTIREERSKSRLLEREYEIQTRKEHVNKYEEFASLKHTLGTPCQNILSYSEVLISYFENEEFTSIGQINEALKEFFRMDLLSISKGVRHDVHLITELLEKGENGLILSDYKLEYTPITKLHALFNKSLQKMNFKFVPAINISTDFKLQPKLGIKANLTLFNILLDNILSNTQKYAFENNNANNQLVIDFQILEENFVLDIKNNGKPFPKNFDKKKFITKYATTDINKGTGIGGDIINRIVEYFNGTWDLILNEDELYPVRFHFQFPTIIND